jgi:hypothetical protein
MAFTASDIDLFHSLALAEHRTGDVARLLTSMGKKKNTVIEYTRRFVEVGSLKSRIEKAGLYDARRWKIGVSVFRNFVRKHFRDVEPMEEVEPPAAEAAPAADEFDDEETECEEDQTGAMTLFTPPPTARQLFHIGIQHKLSVTFFTIYKTQCFGRISKWLVKNVAEFNGVNPESIRYSEDSESTPYIGFAESPALLWDDCDTPEKLFACVSHDLTDVAQC